MPPPTSEPPVDATRRTWLANERTWLAWVRTGLTATAVALAIGKVVPALDKTVTVWPYTAVGVGYAVFGVLLVGYGFARRREVEDAIAQGGYRSPSPVAITVFAVVSVLLGVATAIVLLVA